MQPAWLGDKCIVCLIDGEQTPEGSLTLEHVIPKNIGGLLTCPFLCKRCNDRFGHDLDKTAKTDPSNRLSAIELRNDIPDLYRSLETGQKYRVVAGPAELVGKFSAGEIIGKGMNLPDGSIMLSERETRAALRGMLRSSGASESEIADGIERFENAETGERASVGNDISVIKWVGEDRGPILRSADQIHDLLLIKIAYEFLALMIGKSIYADQPALAGLRQVLMDHRLDESAVRVERLMADTVGAFHGISFEGNEPHARFQIRLFGRWAYRVHFMQLVVENPNCVYTSDLKTGKHWVEEWGDTAAA